jgi:hypothetical protein
MRLRRFYLALLCLFSCAIPDPSRERLLLSFPEPPPSWSFLGPLSFSLRWRDASGQGREAVMEAGGKLEIELRRGEFQAVLAYPRGGASGLAPAGCLYPESLEESDPYGRESEPRRLSLSWAGGWLASVCRRLEAGGLEPERYDLEALARLAGSCDPWAADPGAVALRLSEGRFRSSLVSSAPRFAVELPGPGPWAPESPLAPPPVSAADGAAFPFTAELPVGTSRFVGVEEALLVSVDKEGSSCVVRCPR